LCGADVVGSGEATFVVLDNRRATATHPLPSSSTLHGIAPLGIDELTPEESAVLALACAAEAHRQPPCSFLEAFWGLLPTAGDGWAECTFMPGMQVANRVGDVQGGILLALASETGVAALPAQWRLVDVSARYLAAGTAGQIAFVDCRVVDPSGGVVLRADLTLVRDGERT